MLWHASAIKGYAIGASDGDIGAVGDFLFDDASWLVRWLVVDTGNWLSGRKVLLPPSALGRLNADNGVFAVKLTKQQVKDSPRIDTNRPVSRQMEASIYDYYGWGPYWGAGFYMGGYGYMPVSGMASPYLGARRRDPKIDEAQADRDDVHLRSVEAVTGYHIHARNGEIGHVEDFLIEDADWSVRYLVVDTKNWWPGKTILVSSQSAGEIDWTDRLVNLDVDRQRIKDSPAYDPSMTIDRTYDENLLTYYDIKAPPRDPLGRPVMRSLIAGNWKMHGMAPQLAEIEAIAASVKASPPFADLLICLPATLIARAVQTAAGRIAIGGEDCSAEVSGAFTGDISPEMLKGAGAAAVIVGHSERRQHHAENDAMVAAKAKAAQRAGLLAIICIGETQSQRLNGKALSVCGDQFAGSVPDGMTTSAFAIGYEPLWAIGSGHMPTSEEITEMHAHIRQCLVARFGGQGNHVRILYGGSVNPSNARDILALPEVGGALVGRASLEDVSFEAIFRAVPGMA